MNCKPDDLAVVVRVRSKEMDPFMGRIVTVRSVETIDGEACWNFDRMPLKYRKGRVSGTWFHIPDAWLRPIRGTDGEDETLQWKDVPHKEHA